MRSILHSLAWKEWHEHKWKFVSILCILWATACLALSYGHNDGFGLAVVIVSFCVVPFAVFLGVATASNERSRRTLPFLQALPAPMWPIAITKLIFGLLTLTASVVLTLPLLYGWARWIEGSVDPLAGASTMSGNVLLDVVIMCTTLAASFFIWSAAAGVNRKDEVSAGAMALVAIIGWYVILTIIGYALYEWTRRRAEIYRWDTVGEWLMVFGFSTGAGGFLPASESALDVRANPPTHLWHNYPFLAAVLTATMSHLALAGWYVRRFGRTVNLGVRSPQPAVREASRPDWLPPPRQSAVTAIVWKQFRESGPLVAAGLAGVIGITLAIFGSDTRSFVSQPARFVEMLVVVSGFIGFAITLIVGVGVCFYDISPQQNTFWRSRPINPDTWFWSKFFTGLAILVLALDIPLLVVIFSVHPNPNHFMSANSVTVILAGQFAIFAAAVATTCLVRHAVYAAILSIPLMYLGVVVLWIVLKLGGVLGLIASAPKQLIDMSNSQLVWGFWLTFFVSTALGWLSVRYDWGRKSRY